MLGDLRLILRQLRSTPGFALASVVTLALGIGVNTAIFSLTNSFMRPLPVSHPEQLVVIANQLPGDDTGMRYRFSFPALQDYRARATAFSEVFGYDIRIGGLTIDGKTSPFVYQVVTGNLFPALGLAPAAGRLFARGEGEHTNAESVVVLGYSFWRRRFGGDPAVIGTTLRFEGMPIRIVGVAPEGFRGLIDSTEMDGYVPLDTAPRWGRSVEEIFVSRSMHPLTMVARLKDGVSVAEAQASVDIVTGQLAAEYPATEKDTAARVMPEPIARPVPMPMMTTLMPVIRLLLTVLSFVVLVIACMNVANLLLIRATARERDMAVRASLGAGRARLVRLLLLESGILSMVGTVLGLGLGWVLNDFFLRSIDLGASFNFKLDARFDLAVFGYTTALALFTALIVGALPARKASRANVTQLLHDGGRAGSSGAARQRVRNALVVAQIAGSLVLLIVAGLCIRNLRTAQMVNLGFDADQVVTARLDTLNIGMDQARSDAFYDDLIGRLRSSPGVESAALSFSIPLGWIFGGYVAYPEGDALGAVELRPAIGANSVSPEFFDTLKIPRVDGRGFTSQDTLTSTRVAVVNETLAARFWPSQNPIGQRIEIFGLDGDPWKVVGVVKTSKYLAVFEHELPYLYLPIAQNPGFLRQVTVRSTAPVQETATRLARIIGELEPDLPIADVRPLRRIIAGNLGFVLFRVGAWQASAMGTLGLALALIGIYGVVSYQTAQRTKEIGIRIALGAEPKDVRRLVLRQGVWLIGVGVAVGLVLTFTLTAALDKVLVLVSATDPVTFMTVAPLLAASALAACYVPAWRATRVPPAEALRHE